MTKHFPILIKKMKAITILLSKYFVTDPKISNFETKISYKKRRFLVYFNTSPTQNSNQAWT